MSVLRDGMTLKPFYGDNDYSITTQKIDLNFFHLLKVIGTGGFSKVYLCKPLSSNLVKLICSQEKRQWTLLCNKSDNKERYVEER